MPHDGASSAAVHALDSRGVFDGTLCGQDQDHFCPQEPLTRAHMAVWLVRLIDGTDPPGVKDTRFSDVGGDHPQSAFIERFADLGITAGCSTVPLSYCPDGHVTRAQTATLLAHAYDLESADPAGFTDVAVGGIHSADIDALFSAGITAGCATEPLRFCPQRATPRAQMALLLVRADDYAAERQAALESLNSESLSDDGNPPGGGDTPRGNDNPPGGDDNPPPPTLIVIPPKEDEFLLQTAPEPLGCRATGAPIATKNWIKIGNWEWDEPNHNPAIPQNTPGYWQPDWVEESGGVGKPKWNAPFISKPSRRVAGQTEFWRMKEVEYYRITRSPAWDFGQIIVDVDDLQSFYGPDGNEVVITVVEGRDLAPTSTQPRVDGLWTYTMTDYEQDSAAPGYIYTIEASTCENGPWSQPLELQWKFPNAPTIRPEFTYLTRYGEDGNLLPDNGLALNIGWKYERGEFYEVRVDILDSEDNLLYSGLRYKFYDHLSQPGASWVERLELTSIFQITEDDNLAGSGKQIRIWLRVCKDRGLFALAPCSRNTELILSTKNYQGPKVAND